MDEHIKKMVAARDEAYETARKYEAAIKAVREICEHEWVYTGHNHNYECYACTKCGLEEER